MYVHLGLVVEHWQELRKRLLYFLSFAADYPIFNIVTRSSWSSKELPAIRRILFFLILLLSGAAVVYATIAPVNELRTCNRARNLARSETRFTTYTGDNVMDDIATLERKEGNRRLTSSSISCKIDKSCIFTGWELYIKAPINLNTNSIRQLSFLIKLDYIFVFKFKRIPQMTFNLTS